MSELNALRLIGKEKSVFDYTRRHLSGEFPEMEKVLKELQITDAHYYKINSVLLRKCYQTLVPGQEPELLQYLKRKSLFQLLRPFPPAWSGSAFGCALPYRNPQRRAMHPLERHADQLKAAGIWPDAPTSPGAAPPPDASWIAHRTLAPRVQPGLDRHHEAQVPHRVDAPVVEEVDVVEEVAEVVVVVAMRREL